MLDLTAITVFLAGLGPWGIAAGVGLTLLAQWAKKKFPQSPPANPAVPSPGPVPAPSPDSPIPAAPTGRPLIDLALKILAGIAARRFPTMTQAEALERHLVQEASRALDIEDYDKAKAAEKK